MHNVLEILFVHSNEVKSSNHMGKEGLARALNFLSANCLEVNTLNTDRLSQISKFIVKPLRTVVAYMRQGNIYFTVCKQIIVTSPAFTL